MGIQGLGVKRYSQITRLRYLGGGRVEGMHVGPRRDQVNHFGYQKEEMAKQQAIRTHTQRGDDADTDEKNLSERGRIYILHKMYIPRKHGTDVHYTLFAGTPQCYAREIM